MISLDFSKIRQVFQGRLSLFRQGQSLLKRQQRIVFALYVSGIVIGLVANLAGLTGPQTQKVLLLNSTFLAVVLALTALCLCRRLSLSRTFCVMAVVSQVFTSNELLICAFHPSDYNLMLIIGNMFLLVANVLMALIAYMKYTSYILAGMSVATYVACMCITGDAILENFCILVVLLFIIVAVLGHLLSSNLRRLNTENETLRKEEEEILSVLRMERDQVKAYVRLAKARHEAMETDRLLSLLGEDAQRNVIRNVREALTARDIDRHPLADALPELSPSELEICRLVILGRPLKEICTILNKAESNITCQRVNIRKKLGLKQGENLNLILKERFEQYKTRRQGESEDRQTDG